MPEDFFVEHSNVAVALIALLFTSLVSFIVWWFKVIRSRIVEHIKRSEEVIVPNIDAQFDELARKLEEYHIGYLIKFSDVDKRLLLLEVDKKDDISSIIGRLDVLAEKMDKRNG